MLNDRLAQALYSGLIASQLIKIKLTTQNDENTIHYSLFHITLR